jgi:hypothetical protein
MKYSNTCITYGWRSSNCLIMCEVKKNGWWRRRFKEKLISCQISTAASRREEKRRREKKARKLTKVETSYWKEEENNWVIRRHLLEAIIRVCVLLTRYCRRFTLCRSDFFVSCRACMYAEILHLILLFKFDAIKKKEMQTLTVHFPVQVHKKTLTFIDSTRDFWCMCECICVCLTQ